MNLAARRDVAAAMLSAALFGASTPMFGITPCPVTIFTLGLLLLTTAPVPAWPLVVPFLWPLADGSAAFLPDIPQDWLLPFSGADRPVGCGQRRRVGSTAAGRA